MQTPLNKANRHPDFLIKQDDKKMAEYLFDNYAPALYGYILKAVENEKVATSILEKSFIEIAASCKTIDCSKRSLFSWMYSICTKKITEVSRRSSFHNHNLIPAY